MAGKFKGTYELSLYLQIYNVHKWSYKYLFLLLRFVTQIMYNIDKYNFDNKNAFDDTPVFSCRRPWCRNFLHVIASPYHRESLHDNIQICLIII